MAEAVDPAFESLLAFLKEERAFDFTGYKRATLVRRIRRRMEAVELHEFDEYTDYLQVHPEEFTALFNTIMINVTGFFRDSEAWTYFGNQILPGLLSRRDSSALRAWTAGCASGEEAYSVAMLLAETVGLDEFRERVKIYATDVDEEALAYARAATYTARELEPVPAELREKYFDPVGSRHIFRKELRRSVIFGRNDLVQDAPISHVDLLTCRNTLMYFNAETQHQILNRLHFALRPDGVLFLGKAEMLLSSGAMFRPIELKQRLFTKVPAEKLARQLKIPANGSGQPERAAEAHRLQLAALMSSAAAQLVLDDEGRLALCNHRAMHLFGLSQRDLGRPIQDLEVSYRPVELRAHLSEALDGRHPVWVRNVTMPRAGSDPLLLDVQVVPLHDDNGVALGATAIFNDVTQHRQLQDELLHTNRQLETAYEELQSTNEELQTTNEELQTTNEELETTNEELQSTNEELETMNEELQSMNDEMQLSNEALREGQDEVDRLNRFMAAVLGSMNAGVAVVDGEVKVLAWNSRAEDLWGVRADEAAGAHLFNLDIGLPLERLRQSIRRHLDTGQEPPDEFLLDAVNRRGRAVQVKVTVSPIREDAPAGGAAIIVMDVMDGVDGAGVESPGG